MQAGQQEQREPEPEQTSQEQQKDEPSSQQESSLLDVVTAVVILVRETWRDRWSLAKAEARLSLKSALLVVLLVFFMAMVAMLVWVLLLGGASLYAWESGIHWGWILGGLLLAQLGLIWYLRRQARRLIHWIGFPETRRAFSSVSELEPSQKEEAAEKPRSDDATAPNDREANPS
ncbi:hypothetical protein [Marinimicrobium locisalis]|uniref:hypothetical protein n=1 Tax=Marinimicrobium locisalis TaxID=546022 RepID=UPI0032213E04